MERKVIRYFYRFNRHDSNRPGGDWWYTDFDSIINYRVFQRNIKPNCYKEYTDFECYDPRPHPMHIHPFKHKLRKLLKGHPQ